MSDASFITRVQRSRSIAAIYDRIKNVRDELNEGDQIMVMLLALGGNKIKLSRKTALCEQRGKIKK